MLVDDANLFPRRLRQLRLELGWSLEDLAQAMQTSKGTVSNWEATTDRQREPSIGALLSLAKWFGVSMDYLLGVPGSERDSPQVLKGKAALRERFPIEVKTLPMPTSGVRLHLAVKILEEASPEAFWDSRVAANLLMPIENYHVMLQQAEVPENVVERFSRFAGIPSAWFLLRPGDI